MGKVIGIDLGTTNSCVAILESGVSQIIPNKEGGRTTPSVVAFTEKGERLVGQIAKRQAVTNAANTIYAAKRLIGRKYKPARGCSMLARSARTRSSTPRTATPHAACAVATIQPAGDLVASCCSGLKQSAEEFLGERGHRGDHHGAGLLRRHPAPGHQDAGKIAGLTSQRIINEPTAAALAYGLGKRRERKDRGLRPRRRHLRHLDHGDDDGVFEVLSTCGDSFLGGEDFDQRIVDWLLEAFEQETGINLRPTAWPCSG